MLVIWRLPYEKVGDARLVFLFWPLRGTKKGVVQTVFPPQKGTKIVGTRNWKRAFRNKGFILSRKFTSLAPEPWSATISAQNVTVWCLAPQAVPELEILTPKRYDEHPRPFNMGVPPDLGGGGVLAVSDVPSP